MDLLWGNPRRLNFILSCAAVLQKYDAEREEWQRNFQAAMQGVDLKAQSSKSGKPSTSNGQKRTMTQQDIMRSYGK